MEEKLSCIVAVTQGEQVLHYNVFRRNPADDVRDVAHADLASDALAWLKSRWER